MRDTRVDGRHGRDHHEHQHPAEERQQNREPAALPADDCHQQEDRDEHGHQEDFGEHAHYDTRDSGRAGRKGQAGERAAQQSSHEEADQKIAPARKP